MNGSEGCSSRAAHHGRLSSASTGKLAALRLPFAVLSDEKVMSLDGAGTSMSISSSKSDILFWRLYGKYRFEVTAGRRMGRK